MMNTLKYFHRLPISFRLLLVVFGGLIFSYHPVLQLGMVDGTHLDVSLLYLLVLITVGTSAQQLWKQRRQLWSYLAWRLLLFYTLYLSLSIFWSPNTTRAGLTAGFAYLLLLLVSTALVHGTWLSKHESTLKIVLGWSFVAAVLFALWQLIGEAAGMPSSLTLLPAHYQSALFGIARPTAFSLEPQFFASLLLVPYLWSLHAQLRCRFSMVSLVLFVSATLLLLTLSRGAVGAALIGTLILLVGLRFQFKNFLRPLVVLIGSLLITSLMVVSLAQVNQRDTISGAQALSRTINHLSLGTLSLPLPTATPAQPSTSRSSQTIPESSTESNGYVESSTSSRLSMSEAALSLWSRDGQTLLLGVGVGGFGTALHARDSSFNESSIVNNNYLEVLVETGLIGLGLFVGFLLYLGIELIRHKQWLAGAIFAAFMIQWCFFSGNANILHVWLFIGIALQLIYRQKSARP